MLSKLLTHIHGVEQNSNEDTDKLVLHINNDLEIDLTEEAIDCTHRIGEVKRKSRRFDLL